MPESIIAVSCRSARHVGQRNGPALADRKRMVPNNSRRNSATYWSILRGFWTSTLVVLMSEFDRTLTINAMAGRDHHGRANSLLLAGGGVRGGLVPGRTDAKGILRSTAPSAPPTLPPGSTRRSGSTPPASSRPRTASPSTWSMAKRRSANSFKCDHESGTTAGPRFVGRVKHPDLTFRTACLHTVDKDQANHHGPRPAARLAQTIRAMNPIRTSTRAAPRPAPTSSR